ncbi:MAG TPA: TspO/MBR family protein [Thermoanaerobaculia bacterium]|nr:TspO/MBR family protein [Thermoanaerobaculia bacterium]
MISLLVFVALVAAAAVTGAQFQPGGWYASLAKPSWTPPNWLFGPVWTLLYIGIAVAGWLIWRKTGRIDRAIGVWIAQLVLNAVWSWLFFGMHRPDLALVDIVAMLILIALFIVLARRISPVASYLFVPYLVWVSYATALNFAIWRANPAA